jgi:hypothetical protein
MNRLAGAALCLALSGPGLGATGNDLYDWCTDGDSAVCNSFLIGTAGTVTTLQTWKRVEKDYVCLPEDVTAGQLRELVVAELEANPEQRHLNASSLTLNALLKGFPCE